MTHDASLDSTSKLDALLGSLSTCHEPTAADARRVRLALEAKLAGPTPEEDEASGVHTKWRGEPRLEPDAGERARAWVGSVGRSRWLLVAAAAIAAVAVATLAHPASFEPQWLAALAGNDDGRADAPHSEQGETLFSGSTALALLNEPPRSPSRIVPAALVHDAPCQDWPCLGAEPSVGLSLGGAKVVESGAFEPRPTPEMAGGDRASPPPDIAIPERDDVAGAEGKPVERVRVAPVLAFDVARGGVSPGAGVRVAVPISDDRDLTLEATLQRFEAEAYGERLWAVGAAGCWSPVAGRFDAGLCGDLGYERAAAAMGDEWRLTAGASTFAAWNLTRSAAVYLAMQAAVPVAGDGLGERGTVLRVMAGPRLSF